MIVKCSGSWPASAADDPEPGVFNPVRRLRSGPAAAVAAATEASMSTGGWLWRWHRVAAARSKHDRLTCLGYQVGETIITPIARCLRPVSDAAAVINFSGKCAAGSGWRGLITAQRGIEIRSDFRREHDPQLMSCCLLSSWCSEILNSSAC